MMRRQEESFQRAESSINLASNNKTTARPRTARKSRTKMQLRTPTAPKPISIRLLYEAKSEMDSLFRFQRNHTVPRPISRNPQGSERGNLRMAVAKALGL